MRFLETFIDACVKDGMDVCEFLDAFFSGDRSVVEDVPEFPALVLAARPPKAELLRQPLAPLLSNMLRSMIKSPDKKRSLIAAILTAHIYSHILPLPTIRDLLDKAYEVLSETYKECDNDQLAIFLAEVSIARAVVNAIPRNYSMVSGLFKEALKILQALRDDSPGFRRSLGILFAQRAGIELKLGKPRNAISLAEKSLKAFDNSDESKVNKLPYDVLIRGHYLLESKRYVHYSDELIDILDDVDPKSAMLYMHQLALDYTFTGYEPLYEKMMEIKEDLGIDDGVLYKDAIIALARAYKDISELGREVGRERMVRLISGHPMSALAHVLIARTDIDATRIRLELFKAVSKAVRSGYLDIALLAIRIGKEKGVDEKDLSSRKSMISDSFRTRGSKKGCFN